MKKDLNRDTYGNRLEYSTIAKVSTLPKLIFRFNNLWIYQNPSKIFIDLDMFILKCIWKGSRLGTTRILLIKKNKVRGECSPLKCLLCSHCIHDIVTLAEGEIHRSMKRAESPKIDSHKYIQLTFVKGGKMQCNRGKTAFLITKAEALNICRQKHEPQSTSHKSYKD